MKKLSPVWLVGGAVGGLSILLLWPVLNGEFLEWDDVVYLDALRRFPRPSWRALGWAFTSVNTFYYHPLTLLSHLADRWLWGEQPCGHHATSPMELAGPCPAAGSLPSRH